MTSTTRLLDRTTLPRNEAIRLMAAAAGLTRSRVLAGAELDAAAVDRYAEMVEQRIAGIPLQHLEGTVPFGDIEIATDHRALIPRPESEYLWSLLVDRTTPRRILDLCTGTGALALALAGSFPGAVVVATDLSPDAAALARENAQRTGLTVDVRHGDLFDALADHERFDLIVANPPYVADAEWADLPVEVRDHEPRIALVGGPAGTEIIERLLDGVGAHLDGVLAVEIGETQGDAVVAMATAARLVDVEILPDLAGRDRYLFARTP